MCRSALTSSQLDSANRRGALLPRRILLFYSLFFSFLLNPIVIGFLAVGIFITHDSFADHQDPTQFASAAAGLTLKGSIGRRLYHSRPSDVPSSHFS